MGIISGIHQNASGSDARMRIKVVQLRSGLVGIRHKSRFGSELGGGKLFENSGCEECRGCYSDSTHRNVTKGGSRNTRFSDLTKNLLLGQKSGIGRPQTSLGVM